MTSETMTCDALDATLEGYLEGTLDAAARATVERHLAACARCGELVADLSEIRMQAAALPTLRPSRDLWDGIAARIDAPVIEIGVRDSALGARHSAGALRARGARRRPMWLGAAAAAMVVVSAGVSHVVTRRTMQAELMKQLAVAPAPVRIDTVVVVQPAATQLAAAPAAPKAASRARGAGRARPGAESRVPGAEPRLVGRAAGDVVYDREIASLRRMLRDRQSQLDPATVTVLEQSLAVIDGAIAQSRAALARDPASAFLNQQLTNALEKKLELLRTAAALPAGRT
ncbi:MAG TPA: zf-HC2 domain-containing protein [Gemmatimonadaceae bacterium]|nr:zf-HC2 domain-containing protein [Gemmatimonadaceae bacterium]